MKTKGQINKEIEKLISEIQNTKGEEWDTLNGWINALEWAIKEEANATN